MADLENQNPVTTVEQGEDESALHVTSNTIPSQSLEKSTTLQTLREVDLHNEQAFKGDDSDGRIEWTLRKALAAAFLAMLYTGSQLPLYFAGATLSFIAASLDAPSIVGWLPVANTLAIAAICPFVGYMQDLVGKREIALIGALMLCVGCAVLGTARSVGQALAGMAIAGAAAGIGELTGLAGLAETVPVKYRGYSIAILTAFVVPFAPYVMYSELFSIHASWRWAAWIPLIYNGVTLLGLAATYFPHAHVRAEGLQWRAIVKRIDFFGGFLSITGLTIFLVALQSGGYTHPWSSAYVLCTLIVGLALIIAWAIYEVKFAKYPMVPRQLFQGQRVVALAFIVAFIAGMFFYSLLNFWPLTISTIWNPDPIRIGLRGFAGALPVALGAIFYNALLSVFKGNCKWVLVAAAVNLTAFGGALAVMTPENEPTTLAVGAVAGWGLGGMIVPAATVAMIAAPDALITTCVALSLSTRAVGGAIGYSIYYNTFARKLKAKLPTLVATYAIDAGLPISAAPEFVKTYLTTPAQISRIPGVTEEIIAGALLGSQWAYAYSLHYVWYTSIAFGIPAIIAAVCLPNMRKFQTNRIAVAL